MHVCPVPFSRECDQRSARKDNSRSQPLLELFFPRTTGPYVQYPVYKSSVCASSDRRPRPRSPGLPAARWALALLAPLHQL